MKAEPVIAFARAWQWQEAPEAGEYSTVEELASANKIDVSYVQLANSPPRDSGFVARPSLVKKQLGSAIQQSRLFFPYLICSADSGPRIDTILAALGVTARVEIRSWPLIKNQL